MREGDARSSDTETGLVPDDARALLRAWLAAVELDLEEGELIAFLQRAGLLPRRPLPPRQARA